MTLTIKEGKRRPTWWIFQLFPWLGYKIKSVSRKGCFHMNCQYKFDGDAAADQLDVNKIFGIGYLWNTKYSARFGWNYNNETNKIDVFAYYHINGPGEFTKLCECAIGFNYLMILNIHDKHYSWSVVNVSEGQTGGQSVGYFEIEKGHNKKLSYNQGLYFGGQQTAPHDITIEISKL